MIWTGRAIARAEIQFPLYVLGALAFFVGVLVVALVMEFLIRFRVQAHIPWAQVRRIVIVPRRQQICLVYDAPNFRRNRSDMGADNSTGTGALSAFVAEAERFAPGRIAPGKLRDWMPAYAWVLIIPILTLGLIALLSLAYSLLHSANGP